MWAFNSRGSGPCEFTQAINRYIHGAGAVRRCAVRADLHTNHALAQLGRARIELGGGTVARRKNYGFEKKQREIRKQRKKDKKAQRRGLIEPTDPGSSEPEDRVPSDPRLRDQD